MKIAFFLYFLHLLYNEHNKKLIIFYADAGGVYTPSCFKLNYRLQKTLPIYLLIPKPVSRRDFACCGLPQGRS
jgi:hypothetical protein